MGARQTLPPHEDEAQKVAKHAKVGKKGAKKRSDPQVGPLAWLLAPMSNGEPLLANTSIRKFQGRVAGYVTDAVEQALLLLEDMAELRDMRRHEIFLSLKRYLAMVRPLPFFLICFLYFFFFPNLCFFPWQTLQASFQAEEITNYCHRQMKKEEGRRIAAVEAFNVSERSNQELKKKP